MPKLKSHRGAAKRFSFTKNGLIKRGHNYKGHLLTKKTRKRKRRLRTTSYVSPADTRMIRKLIPYK